jgi:xanthine dehydrogenase accessory factor
MRNPYLYIARKTSEDQELVLATVVATKGSTPQKPGSSALFSGRKLIYGTVGGGVLEGRVTEFAFQSSTTGDSGLYRFDLNKEIDNKDDAICGGDATVLLDARPERHKNLFKQAVELLDRRTPCVVITVFEDTPGKINTIERFIFSPGKVDSIPGYLLADVSAEAMKLINDARNDSCSLLTVNVPGEKSGMKAFLEPLFPAQRLVIAGAGHIGRALCHLGSRLDFDVTVIDDRVEFANADNLPEADNVIVGNIGESLTEIEKDRNTFIVIVTRGHNDDSEALRSCIGSDSAYIGMIGSRTKIAKMHSNFIEKGWATENQWSSIYAPVGLEINSQSVEEIAVSIAAQLVKERNSVK